MVTLPGLAVKSAVWGARKPELWIGGIARRHVIRELVTGKRNIDMTTYAKGVMQSAAVTGGMSELRPAKRMQALALQKLNRE